METNKIMTNPVKLEPEKSVVGHLQGIESITIRYLKF